MLLQPILCSSPWSWYIFIIEFNYFYVPFGPFGLLYFFLVIFIPLLRGMGLRSSRQG